MIAILSLTVSILVIFFVIVYMIASHRTQSGYRKIARLDREFRSRLVKMCTDHMDLETDAAFARIIFDEIRKHQSAIEDEIAHVLGDKGK